MKNVTIHRETSSDAAHRFEEDYFDWIYIDGNHCYEYVRADLLDYLPKVKTSGYLAGDDYLWGPEEGLPVKRAVAEIVEQGYTQPVLIRNSQFVLQKL